MIRQATSSREPDMKSNAAHRSRALAKQLKVVTSGKNNEAEDGDSEMIYNIIRKHMPRSAWKRLISKRKKDNSLNLASKTTTIG